MMIGEETRSSIRKLCEELVTEYPEAQWDLKSPYMLSIIPDDIKNIDKSKGEYLLLFGKYFQLYNEAFSKLRVERALEYLEERELKERFWHFICEVIADYKALRDATRLEEKINGFLSNISKPLVDYEVLIPILNIDMKGVQINIGDATIRKLNDQDLKKLGLHCLSKRFKLTDSTVIIVPEKGNNPEFIVLRARNKADLIIRTLQASFSTNIFLHEEEMLLKQGELVIYRKRDNPSEGGYSWQRGYKPMPIEIDGGLQKSVEDFVSKIQDIFKDDYPIDLSKRFMIAIKWIGRAIDEHDLDIKIVYLSTALEAILTSQFDRRKGETLAYRMLLLNSHLDEPFIHPAQVLYVYELRSQIVHGGEVGIASKSNYYTMRRVVIDTLIKSIEFIRTNGLKNYEEFIKTLETPEHISQVLGWLKKQEDELSRRIRKHMEKNLKRLYK